MTDTVATTTPARRGGVTIAVGLFVAAVVATAMNAVIAAIAHGAGASSQFQALQLPTYGTFTVIGVLAGAAGWAVVRAKARNPRRVMRVLAPAVVLVSFVPDVLVGISAGLPGASWGGVVALMVMHVVVAAVAIAAYSRTLPLPADRS
jgi:peptidoglycan/LPS O-acetylase OafA/YrhL